MAVEKTVPGGVRTVLVTGGAGYIGSHAVLQLLLAGFRAIVVNFRAVVVDNLNNSSELAVRRVAAIAGYHSRNLAFHKHPPKEPFASPPPRRRRRPGDPAAMPPPPQHPLPSPCRRHCCLLLLLLSTLLLSSASSLEEGRVLTVGDELMGETMLLRHGSRLYRLDGTRSSAWYEVKISYPASALFVLLDTVELLDPACGRSSLCGGFGEHEQEVAQHGEDNFQGSE